MTLQHKQSTFGTINETAMACVIMFFVDTLLAPAKSSDKANDKLFTSMVGLDAAFRASFELQRDDGQLENDKQLDNRFKQEIQFYSHHLNEEYEKHVSAENRDPGKPIRQQLNDAQALSGEAIQEPRFWRAPWDATIFQLQVTSIKTLRHYVRLLETVGEAVVLDDEKNVMERVLTEMQKLPTFNQMQEALLYEFQEATMLVWKQQTNTSGKSQQEDVTRMMQAKSVSITKKEAMIQDVNRSRLFTLNERARTTLEDDLPTRIAVVIRLTHEIGVTLDNVINTCIKFS